MTRAHTLEWKTNKEKYQRKKKVIAKNSSALSENEVEENSFFLALVGLVSIA